MDTAKEQDTYSSILLIGDPLPHQEHFEYLHKQNFNQALTSIKQTKHLKVIIINTKLKVEQVRQIFHALHKTPPLAEVLIIESNPKEIYEQKTLVALLNPSQILVPTKSNDFAQQLSTSVIEAVNTYDYHKQNENFYKLFEEQNESLKMLNAELKKGVSKRKLSLKRSQKRLLRLQEQLNLMYESIVGIQNCRSISEIEDFLMVFLGPYMNIQWSRVLIDQKEILDERPIIESQNLYFVFGSALIFDKSKVGHIYFAKKEKIFTKQEESFLLQISEIVSIKINQMLKYSSLLITRSQWQETFKAIKYPVVILNRNYDYIASNRSHLQKKSLNQKKCYEIMFDRKSPCKGCHLGQKFEFRNEDNNKWYYVTSQSLKEYYEDSENLIHIYQDITEEKNIETQIIEKTRLTDLGILAGSLAHELNNPLGGIITFLQLLVDETASSDKDLQKDIQELLQAAIDCKEIIQMILENVRHNKPLSLT